MAPVIELFSAAGRAPASGSPLERGGFMSKAFTFVQFLQDFQGGRLSKALRAEPPPAGRDSPASASGKLLDQGDGRARLDF